MPGSSRPARPAVVQGRHHLRSPRPRLRRQQRRRHRRLPRASPRSSTTSPTSASPPSGSCRSTPPRSRDDGYDIADYTTVHPSYGTLDDFRAFLDEAHRRGLRVITELVINHTSDQHPWFQRARRSPPGSPERDFYVWSDTPDKYKGVRIIFQDFEPSNWTWDPSPRPTSGTASTATSPTSTTTTRPCTTPSCRSSTYWLEMGVDGMRLDAVPYLYEREGTSCENLPETHAFLKKLRAAHRRDASPTACSSPRRTSGRRTPSPISATATSATWRSTSRSCRGMFMAMRHGGPLPDHRHPAADAAASPTTASGPCSSATTTN